MSSRSPRCSRSYQSGLDLRQQEFSWPGEYSCLTLYSVPWKPHYEGSSTAQFALNSNRSAMRFHHLFGDPEAHSQALETLRLARKAQRCASDHRLMCRSHGSSPSPRHGRYSLTHFPRRDFLSGLFCILGVVAKHSFDDGPCNCGVSSLARLSSSPWACREGMTPLPTC